MRSCCPNISSQHQRGPKRETVVPDRRHERFDTWLPIRLERGSGETRNVSANGIYFVTDVTLVRGQPVSFTLEFLDMPGGPLQVRCNGKVVRVEQSDGKIGVGAAIDNYKFLRPGSGKDESD